MGGKRLGELTAVDFQLSAACVRQIFEDGGRGCKGRPHGQTNTVQIATRAAAAEAADVVCQQDYVRITQTNGSISAISSVMKGVASAEPG